MSERKTATYKGHQIVVAKDGELFNGVAWGRLGEGAIAKASGSSAQEVADTLKSAIDSPEIQEKQKQKLIAKHGEFLRSRGLDPTALTLERVAESTRRIHRVANCWNCKNSLDNENDLECTGCLWIICTSCGACGHGHPVYGKNYLGLRMGSSEQLSIKKFDRIEDAKALAQREAGATLQRAADGLGWTVTLRRRIES